MLEATALGRVLEDATPGCVLEAATPCAGGCRPVRHTLAVTQSAALPPSVQVRSAAIRSLVWLDMAEKQKTGSPLASSEYPTSALEGYPSTADESVASVA